MSAHDHHHHHHSSGKNLLWAFFLNLGFAVFEIIGGIYVNSVSIISDALHDLGDSLSLGIAWVLDRKAQKEATNKFTFGYSRFSLLGAVLNSLILVIGGLFIVTEAVQRLLRPEQSNAKGMIIFAIIGIAVNSFAAWKLSKGKSMNERVVSLHLLEDVLGWCAVLVAAIMMLFFDSPYIDPVLSLLITLYILFNVFKRLKESMSIFLQGVPKEIDLEKIKAEILQLDKVASQHDLHIWSLEGEHHIFTIHVKLHNIHSLREMQRVKNEIKQLLKPYHFSQHTIEIELDEESCELENRNDYHK